MPKFLSTMKGKITTAATICSISAMNAAAAGVTIGSDGAVSGEIDKATFMGLAGVVVALLGVIFGVKKGLALLR